MGIFDMQTFEKLCTTQLSFTYNGWRLCVLPSVGASSDWSMQMRVGYWFSLFIEEDFPSCWGLCGDVLSVLHLSHSGLSCLSTPSPVWPRFRGADVDHWFAISKLNIPYTSSEVGLFVFGLAAGSHHAVEYCIWSWIRFSLRSSQNLCVFLCTHLRLEINSENVLPSRRVFSVQPQRSELHVYEEQPGDGNTQHIHNTSTYCICSQTRGHIRV